LIHGGGGQVLRFTCRPKVERQKARPDSVGLKLKVSLKTLNTTRGGVRISEDERTYLKRGHASEIDILEGILDEDLSRWK
jgi:hypothetical protein